MKQLNLAERQTIVAMAERIAGVGCWRYDVKTGTISWSEEVFRIHGMASDGPAPDYDTLLGIYHPDDRTLLDSRVQRALGPELIKPVGARHEQ